MKTFSLVMITALFSTLVSAHNIPEADLAKIKAGEVLQEVNWKEGLVWPEVKMLALVDHTPYENICVFWDFETHKNYLPDMKESNVIEKISPTKVRVHFVMDMPWPVKKTEHTNDNELKKENDSYTLSWKLVKAEQMSDTYGFIQFIPFEGKSIMKYSNQIVPNSSLAGMFKGRVAKDVDVSIKAIIKHLKKEISSKKEHYLSKCPKL